jgi:hypothetical protein
MMGRLKYLSLMLCLAISSCTEITTEVDGKDYYKNDQLAIVGYLSNFGAVVNVQKTQSPLNSEKDSTAVPNATVELLSADNDAVVVILEKRDAYNYVSPDHFLPEKEKEYYIKVTSPGFSTVFSGPQKVMDVHKIDWVELNFNETKFWVEDTTVYTLFGKPRQFRLSLYINNPNSVITNVTSNFLFRYNSDLYEYTNGEYVLYNMPHFFFNLGMGGGIPPEIPTYFSYQYFFKDQIITDETISYNGKAWKVIDRVENVIVQSVQYSADFNEFFDKVKEYLENRTDPFSIMAEKIPSNMSNKIGFFGSLSITEEEIALPDTKKDSIVFVF